MGGEQPAEDGPTAAGALESDEIVQVSDVFRLLGDPTRVRLLYALLNAGELPVQEAAAAADVLQSTASHALRIMRASRVVSVRRSGRHMFYRLSDAHVRVLLEVAREHIAHDDEGRA